LGEIRNSDTYTAILVEFEPLITSLESSSDDAGLIELLQEISEGKLPINSSCREKRPLLSGTIVWTVVPLIDE
jgi:hypothetical protein